MGLYDVGQITTTDMTSGVQDFIVDAQSLDEPQDNQETTWDSPSWSDYLGYYKSIPELKKAIDALSDWTVGKGFETDTRTEVLLESVTGWGEDTIQSILQNMLIVKKINGDAFAEIIRNEETGTLLNLKPLSPFNIRIVVDKQGIITRYEELNKKKKVARTFQPEDIFHLSNDRIGNEIHGVSVVEACQWVIDARNEAMNDWKRLSHRSTIRVLYVDEDDDEQLTKIKTNYKDAINKGEVLIIPGKPADKQFQELTLPPIANFLQWIQYLENFFYQAVGVPKIILGGSQDFTEASSKIGYLTFEQVYASEQKLLEGDIWNQLALRIEFIRPQSLKDNVQEDEAKNTGQVGIQPNETTVQVGRTE